LLIRRMNASFGKLQNQTLELHDGLNIIQAPNETGKSTWCAFLLSMLYGINSRERDKGSFIADKNRYAAWSGRPMAGQLDCLVQESELTLTRSTRRQTAPMGEFQAVYTGTANAVPDLTGQNCGEALLGVSREVFERSAFIRQNGLAITQDAGLERRIASLITSGEENTSHSEAAAALKKQLTRRRHNKTGLLPTLEAELLDVQRQLSDLETLSVQLAEVRQRIGTHTVREAALEDALRQHDAWQAWQKQQELEQAKTAAEQARQDCELLRRRLQTDAIPEPETIARLRGALSNLEASKSALEKAKGDQDVAAKTLLQAESALTESPFAGMAPTQAERLPLDLPRKPRFPLWLLVLLAVLGAAAGFLIYSGSGELLPAIAGGCGLFGCPSLVIGFFIGKRQNRWEAAAEALREQRDADLDAFTALYQAAETARADANRCSAAAEALYHTFSSNEQAILQELRRFAPTAFDLSAAEPLLQECERRRRQLADAEGAAQAAQLRCEVLAQQTGERASAEPAASPTRSREELTAELAQLRAALAADRSAADRLSGQSDAMGDGVVLRSAEAQLQSQIAALEREYAAIQLAMEVLDTANNTLQNRFAPALGRRTAEIFSQLTDGRYKSVVLDRALHLSAEPQDDSMYRDIQLLSAGAADQLYLAARLAICELVLPEDRRVPLILDDALANFDDERCATVLRWLKEAAKDRQILLFSCHSREADFFSGDAEVFVQRLTNPGEEV